MTLSPDQWWFAALLLIGIIATIGYKTGDVNRERRQQRLRPARDPMVDALTVGRWVEIVCGRHSGLCGWVHDLFFEKDSGPLLVTVRLQDGTFVIVPRADLSPVPH